MEMLTHAQMRRFALFLSLVGLLGVLLVAVFGVAAAGASNGIGPVPPATSSQATLHGFAYASDGTTPDILGGASGHFVKGVEADSSGNSTTTIVNIELPVGVTARPSSECGGGVGEFGYCIYLQVGNPYDSTVPACSDPTGLKVDGNTVSVTISCAPGQSFGWDMGTSSLVTDPGYYDAAVVFRVGSTRRTADNTYEISLPGTFHVLAN